VSTPVLSLAVPQLVCRLRGPTTTKKKKGREKKRRDIEEADDNEVGSDPPQADCGVDRRCCCYWRCCCIRTTNSVDSPPLFPLVSLFVTRKPFLQTERRLGLCDFKVSIVSKLSWDRFFDRSSINNNKGLPAASGLLHFLGGLTRYTS
jgi:hypothetical protein